MNHYLRAFLSLLGIVWFSTTTFAISVDRIVLVERQPDVYVRNIHTALNSKTGQTLVIWSQFSGDLVSCNPCPFSTRGQLLGPDGNPENSSFLILSSSLKAGGANIAYDPDVNQFVLVYSRQKSFDSEFSEVYAIHLKPTGRKTGKAVLLSSPSKIANIRPSIVYDPVNKTTIIIWTRYSDLAPNPNDPGGIFGAVLNSNLSIRHKSVLIENTEFGPGVLFGPNIYDAAIYPIGKLLLAQTLYTPINFQTEFSISQTDATLKKRNTTITNLQDAPVNSGCQFGICFGIDLMQLPGGQMAVLYSQEDGIKKRKISSQGVVADKVTKFFGEPVRSLPVKITGSAFAVSGTSKEVVALGFIPSEIGEAQFWLQRANTKGTPVGAPVEIESGVDSVRGGIISALPVLNPAGHMYAALYLEGERDNRPLVNLGVGLVLLRVNTAP